MKYPGVGWLLCLLVACLQEDVELVPGTGTGACEGTDYPVDAGELEVLMLLDNSASMGVFPAVPLSCVASLMLDCPAGDLTRTPWNVAVSELERFVYDQRSSGISLSLTYFGEACGSDFYARPSVPMGQLPAHADAIVSSLHATIPLSGTATRPALEGVLTYAAARASLPERAARTVVLLLTDGYPDEEDCPDNNLEAVARVTARGASSEPAISTYVFVTSTGLDFSSVARAGGTDKTILADLGSTGVLSEALQAVRAGELASLPCDYPLPDEGRAQPELVNLMSNGVALTRADGVSECTTTRDAWYFDDAAEPTRIVACPSTCAALSRGNTKIRVGCPAHRVPL